MHYWGVRMGAGGKYAALAREQGFVAIGWEELGDVSRLVSLPDDEMAWKKWVADFGKVFEVSGVRAAIGAGVVWRFVRDIHVGDVVLTPHTEERLVFIGRVTSDFFTEAAPTDGCPYKYRRRVEWLREARRDELPEPLLGSLGSILTLYSMDKVADHIQVALGGQLVAAPAPLLERNVVAHTIKTLHDLHPRDFEKFVRAVLEAVGFEASNNPYVADGGIDVNGVLNAEGLAEVNLKVQVKRKTSNVGNEDILKTRGALGVDEHGAVVSLGGFTQAAREEAEAPGKKRILLIDGERFVEMILSHWDALDPAAQAVLGIKKKSVPVHEQFAVV